MTASRARRRDRVLLFLSPVLLLSAPLLDVLGTLRLSLFTAPALLLLAGHLLAGVLLGALAAAALPGDGGRLPRHALFIVALAAVAVAVLDVVFGGHRLAASLLPASEAWAGPVRAVARLGALAAIGLACGVLAWTLRRHVALVLGVFSFVVFFATVLFNPGVFTPAGRGRPLAMTKPAIDLPPFIYIVFDEAMGVAGVEGSPGGAGVAARLRALADRHGFRVYEHAFSRHWSSDRSIPNALNFDFRGRESAWVLAHDAGAVQSRLFDALAQRGYDVVSYGTAHLDFCFAPASRCERFPSFDPFNPYLEVHRANPRAYSSRQDVKASAVYRFVRHAFSSSYLLFRYCALLASFHEPLPGSFVALDSYGFPAWFDRFADDVTSAPRGRAYFAHMLAPHAPYVLDAACAETGRSVRKYFDPEEQSLTGKDAERRRETLYAAYHEQYRCTISKLEALLDRLAALPAFSDATLVVHGDHGSRIATAVDPRSLSDRDMIDNSSTLYAIRAPGIAAGRDARLTSVQRLTAEYFSGTDAEGLGPDDLTVAIEPAEGGSPVLRAMPDAAPR